jgi:hypothetical protein
MITGAKPDARSLFQPFLPDTKPEAVGSYVLLRTYSVLEDFVDAIHDRNDAYAATLCKEFQVIAEYLAAYAKMKASSPRHKGEKRDEGKHTS